MFLLQDAEKHQLLLAKRVDKRARDEDLLHLCSGEEKAFSEPEGWNGTLVADDAGGDGLNGALLPTCRHVNISRRL